MIATGCMITPQCIGPLFRKHPAMARVGILAGLLALTTICCSTTVAEDEQGGNQVIPQETDKIYFLVHPLIYDSSAHTPEFAAKYRCYIDYQKKIVELLSTIDLKGKPTAKTQRHAQAKAIKSRSILVFMGNFPSHVSAGFISQPFT